jgi:anti-sigma regulatory factor (Ser/Thr protein kinase)
VKTEPLVLRAGAEAAGDVTAYVQLLARRGELDRHQAYQLRLAADEITTNIALHGYRGATGPLRLAGGCDGQRVWLRIEDEAPPFDPRTHDAAKRLAEGISGGREGGFGLFLALTGLDEFRYEYADGCNRNTLIIRRRPSPEAGTVEGEHDAYQCRADRR